MNDKLLEIRTAHLNAAAAHTSDAVKALTGHLKTLYAERLLAVVFYGSCMRQEATPKANLQHTEPGIIDLYAIVSDYHEAWPERRLLALAARALPPNVFFLQQQLACGDTISCKYAVLTLRDFEAGCSRWFHNYVYGRFAQPVAISYCSSEATKTRLLHSLGAATDRLLTEAVPLITSPFTGRELWKLALELSYSTELRPEPKGRVDQLLASDSNYYQSTARAWLAAAPNVSTHSDDQNITYTATEPRLSWQWRARWRMRAVWGKLLSMLRLLKAIATFEGAIEYAIYKVEKHTGEPIQIAESIRKRRLLFIPVLIFKLLRATI